MTGLEAALVILVLIWIVIFIIIAVALIILFWQLKKGIDRINDILEKAADITSNVATPINQAVTGFAMLKDAFSSVVKIRRRKRSGKGKKYTSEVY